MEQASISPLQLMQARFQKKLLQDKQQIMMQLYPPTEAKSRGGAVRQFFLSRREKSGHDEVDLLNSSGGLISLQQSFNNSWPANSYSKGKPKQGSPVGWDKSYLLSPIDRESSGGSSVSSNSQGHGWKNKSKIHPTTQYPPQVNGKGNRTKRRTPSLDRYAANTNFSNKKDQLQSMRRSNSQILVSNNREKENDTHPPVQRTTQKKKPAVLGTPKSISPPPPPPIYSKAKHEEPKLRPMNKNKKTPVPPTEAKNNFTLPFNKQANPTPKKNQTNNSSTVRHAPTNTDPNMAECTVCGRTFAKDRIEKHRSICQKTAKKKRKVFDPAKMRTRGTELEEYYNPASAQPQPQPQSAQGSKGNWRSKHKEFIESIRHAKKVQQHIEAGGKASDLPPPPPMDTSDYLQCPYCERKFSEAAAERHIPKCANIKSNKRLERK